jgi:hypothetical protein
VQVEIPVAPSPPANTTAPAPAAAPVEENLV